ncbi:DBF4-type zinc finger-containing protein 2 [Erinaceus europaeus]|uniref:DBF4-type zinc finger-containing protein 2 n=1 Tax=Erinaceus europaeus TaxID=9365 RepID=A0ABM3XMI4_ERIEU|nr:DBF4-type zinc finger-containing protein 2 [Erinaceus europaeus]
MQNRRGYCSYCCVYYNHLEQHLASAQHRYLTSQNRRRLSATSLMERFLQDVLRYHPYHYQESRLMQNERLLKTTASMSEMIPIDDVTPEEMTADNTKLRGERSTKDYEPSEKLYSCLSGGQEYTQHLSERPSVIKKLEKGKQQPLKFAHKIGGNIKEFITVGTSQMTNEENLVCPLMISDAPAHYLFEHYHARPVINYSTKLSQTTHLDSVSKCDPNKVDRDFEQLARDSGNPLLLPNMETSSDSVQHPEESNRKPLSIQSDELITQDGVKPQGTALSTDLKFHKIIATEGSLKCEFLYKLAKPAINSNKTNLPFNKGILEDAIPKHHEKFSYIDCTQEEKHLAFNRSASLEQRNSVSSEMKFNCNFPQSVPNQPEENVQDLQKKEQNDQEVKSYESRGSEMSFDCNSSFHSLSDQSKMTTKEIHLSKEVDVDFQYKNNESCVSETSSGCSHLAINQIHISVKDANFQKAMPISLVDESYESSSSEMNFDCDVSLKSTDDYHQQPENVNSPKEVHFALVDINYGSSSSEVSLDSNPPSHSLVDQCPGNVTETEVQKKGHIDLVNNSYGSDCSETSFDGDASLQSVVDHSQLIVKERNRKDRLIYLKDEDHFLSSAKPHLDCDVSVAKVADEPQRTVEEINLLEENNDLLALNYESHEPEIKFHTCTQLTVQRHRVTLKETNPQEIAIELENKSVKSSVADLSFDSQSSPYQSVNDQLGGTLGEINVKESNVDVEVKSCECCSSELTFDSDPPFLSATELDTEKLRKECINLEGNSESNSSEITFDSDIILCTTVDQPEVVINEEPFDLGNKSGEICISEISFDSDITLYSGTDQPELVVKETTIQKDGCVHLGRMNDQLSSSEISLCSSVSPHSMTISPEVVVKKPNLKKKDHIHLQSKESGPSVSELSLDYDLFHSMTTHPEDTIKGISLQREENPHINVPLENGPSISEISLKSDISSYLVADNSDISAKEINYQEEENVNLEDKSNGASVFKTSFYPHILLQSGIHKPEVAVEEIRFKREKHAKWKDESAEFSDSGINMGSEIPHFSVTTPQMTVKEINLQKEVQFVENKSTICRYPEIILDSGVSPQLKIKTAQRSVLKKVHFDPNDENTEARGFDTNLGIGTLHAVTDQPQLALLKEKHAAMEDIHTERKDCKIHFYSDDPFKPLAERGQGAIGKTVIWKNRNSVLKNKFDEHTLHDSAVSLQPGTDNSEITVKRMKFENEAHVYLKDKDSQYSGSVMSSDSDFLGQERIDQPQINCMEQEHIDLEDKHNQSCGSEISFDSNDPVQSVVDQLSETTEEVSLWKDEVDMKNIRSGSKGFEIVCDSNMLQSVSSQTEKVDKEINPSKKHNALEDKIVEPGDSIINPDSNELFQSATTEIQESIIETNLLREGCVCPDQKRDSEVIYVSNIPLQSVVEQPPILEEGYSSLEDENHLQRGVKEISHWKEDHIYLEDKSYRVGDFEVSCDSDTPIYFVADQFPMLVKEINSQEGSHNDLEKHNYETTISEIKCNSGVCLQLKVDEPHVVCKEINFEVEENLGMEEKTGEPNDSEIMCDSDGLLQILVDHNGVSVKETNLQKMLFMDLVTSDNDCEIISGSDTIVQPVTDSPQTMVKGVNCANSVSFDLEAEKCDTYCSELEYIYEASPGSLTKQSKNTFKVVNQKKDYIILQESSCESYSSEINIQIDTSPQSINYQSQLPDKSTEQCIDSEDRSCESNSPQIYCKWEDTSHPVTGQLQNADQKVSLQVELQSVDPKDKNCQSSVFIMGCNSSSVSPIHQVAGKDNHLNLKCTDLESMSCEPCGSRVNFQCDPSLPFDTNYTQETINAVDLSKMSCELKETHSESYSKSVPTVNSVRTLGKAKGLIEDNLDEPVLEALPHVPPSFVGKTWSQIMREDDMKINVLVREFREGRFHCYFDDDCESRKVKKKNLNEETKISWADVSQMLYQFKFSQILMKMQVVYWTFMTFQWPYINLAIILQQKRLMDNHDE